jgi:hypothetical protein
VRSERLAELYSNWVCTQVIAALEDRAPRVHADHGEFRFAFSGTHLASFDGFDPRLHLWTEFRASLDKPVGKGRKKAIQHDITLLADPITAGRSPLAVECKQYLKAGNKNFADAITDYAHGHLDARIVLVNYGPARSAAVLDRVDPEVLARAVVIGWLRPDRPEQVRAFREEVRSALGAGQPPAVGRVTELPVRHTLRWGALPSDLDLHVRIFPTDGQCVEVDYDNHGALDEHPFCELDTYITTGHGPEVTTTARWLSATYTVVVRRFSNDGPLAGSGATVTLEHPDGSLEFRCPDEIDGDEWTVCTIDGRTGSVVEGSPQR